MYAGATRTRISYMDIDLHLRNTAIKVIWLAIQYLSSNWIGYHNEWYARNVGILFVVQTTQRLKDNPPTKIHV